MRTSRSLSTTSIIETAAKSVSARGRQWLSPCARDDAKNQKRLKNPGDFSLKMKPLLYSTSPVNNGIARRV